MKDDNERARLRAFRYEHRRARGRRVTPRFHRGDGDAAVRTPSNDGRENISEHERRLLLLRPLCQSHLRDGRVVRAVRVVDDVCLCPQCASGEGSC